MPDGVGATRRVAPTRHREDELRSGIPSNGFNFCGKMWGTGRMKKMNAGPNKPPCPYAGRCGVSSERVSMDRKRDAGGIQGRAAGAYVCVKASIRPVRSVEWVPPGKIGR